MAVSFCTVAVVAAAAAVVLPLLPVGPVFATVGGWLWNQVRLTLVMLAAVWSPVAADPIVFLVAFVGTVVTLTWITVRFLQSFARQWNDDWNTLWFTPGDSWQRRFVEKWGRGPVSRTVVFVVGNVSMLLFEGLLGAPHSSAAGLGSSAVHATTHAAANATAAASGTPIVVAWLQRLSFFALVQNTFAVLVYVSMLLAWWAARLNMLMPARERSMRAATTVAYAVSVATMYAYVPESGEGDNVRHLDYVQFCVLMLLNPVPTMVLGYLALKPCLWVAQQAEAWFPHDRAKSVLLMYTTSSLFVLMASNLGACLGSQLVLQAPVVANLILLHRLFAMLVVVVLLGAMVVLYYHLIVNVWTKTPLFLTDWTASVVGTTAPRTPVPGEAGHAHAQAHVPTWSTVRILNVPRLFTAISQIWRDFVRMVWSDEVRPVERRALSFLTFILRTVVDFSPFVRRLRKVGIDALKNEVTSFEMELWPVVSNPTPRPLDLAGLQLQLRDWSQRTWMGRIPRPQLLWQPTALAEVTVTNFKIEPNEGRPQRRRMVLAVKLHTPMLVRWLQIGAAALPGVQRAAAWLARLWSKQQRVQPSDMVQDMLTVCESLLDKLIGDRQDAGEVSPHIDLVLNIRRPMLSVTIPLVQYVDGDWHGDMLSGWDQSGLLRWCVTALEEYRRRTMGEAMTRAALHYRLQDQLHGVYTTLASLANPDETAPEADWVLRVAIGAEAANDIFQAVSHIYERERDAAGAGVDDDGDVALLSWKEWVQRLVVNHQLSLLVLGELSYRAMDTAWLASVGPDQGDDGSMFRDVDVAPEQDTLLNNLPAPLRQLWAPGDVHGRDGEPTVGNADQDGPGLPGPNGVAVGAGAGAGAGAGSGESASGLRRRTQGGSGADQASPPSLRRASWAQSLRRAATRALLGDSAPSHRADSPTASDDTDQDDVDFSSDTPAVLQGRGPRGSVSSLPPAATEDDVAAVAGASSWTKQQAAYLGWRVFVSAMTTLVQRHYNADAWPAVAGLGDEDGGTDIATRGTACDGGADGAGVATHVQQVDAGHSGRADVDADVHSAQDGRSPGYDSEDINVESEDDF